MKNYNNAIIIAINNKKIREYSESEKEQKTGVLINYLLALLGISMTNGDDKEMHYIILEEFINETLINYTYEEIKLAFKKLVKGDFNIDVYNKLDSLLVGKVMKAYDNDKQYKIKQEVIKQNKIKEMPPELTQSQKDEIVFLGIIKCYNDFISNERIPSTKIYYYDFLFERGFLPKDAATKNAVYKMACENIKNRVNLTKEDHIINQITNKDGSKSNELIIECKRISLERFFNQFRNENQLKTKLKI